MRTHIGRWIYTQQHEDAAYIPANRRRGRKVRDRELQTHVLAVARAAEGLLVSVPVQDPMTHMLLKRQ